MAENAFASLAGEQFIVLTTYRRSGDPMPTAVWFVDVDGTLYITTVRNAGKVKRIGNNPQVTVAPSDQAGNVHGPAIPGQARLLDKAEFAAANAALRNKYQPMYDAIIARTDASVGGERVFLAVEPAS